jgi:four helix bundle protein
MKDEIPPFELRERTKLFGLRIVRMFVALPKSDEARVLGKQVLRSGTSVGANYREAHRARSKAEFVSKLGDCLKELDETAYWLELLTRVRHRHTRKTRTPPRRNQPTPRPSSPPSPKTQKIPRPLHNS